MAFSPHTKTGRIAARLLAACATILAVAIVVSVIADDRPDGAGFDVFRFVAGTGFLLTGIGAVVVGIVAVARDRDRSIAVFLAVALGLLAVAFALGDVIAP